MEVKDILVALTTYPDSTDDAAVIGAVSIAAELNARMAAVACGVRVKIPSSPFGNALIDLSALAAAEARKSADSGEHLLKLFEGEESRRGVVAEAIREESYSSEAPAILAEYARLRDLTIVPVPQADAFDQWYAETIIFESGRPAPILPYDWKKRADFKIKTVCIAWDFSMTAARAVADSIPLLQKAERVFVVTVTNEKKIDSKRSAAELARHLAHHGVKPTVETIDAAGRTIGKALEIYCSDRDADLLIIGAYGHSHLREFVLGGATHSFLSKPTLPILMSH